MSVYDECLEEFDDMEYDGRMLEFAQPGSALRAASKSNPRIHKCPTCEEPNKLTAKDVALGYQCDACADKAESGWY